MCWHRKTTFAHPVLSVSHVTQIIPSNLHSKSGCIIPTLSIRKWRPGEVSSTIGHPPRPRALLPPAQKLRTPGGSALPQRCTRFHLLAPTDTSFILPGASQVQVLRIRFAGDTPGPPSAVLIWSPLAAASVAGRRRARARTWVLTEPL